MVGCGRLIARMFLLGFGLIFIVAGVAMATIGARQASAEADRATRLAPLSVAALDDSPPGREALVEGRVSARNRALFQGFVAYVREEYRGSDDDHKDKWSEDERRTPRLLIDLAGGAVALADDRYDLDNPPHAWQEPGALTWNGFAGEGTKRYRGFQAGDIVMVIGTLAPGREGMLLRAERVYGGTRSAYIAERRSTARWMPWIGGLFGLAGAAIASAGVWWLARR